MNSRASTELTEDSYVRLVELYPTLYFLLVLIKNSRKPTTCHTPLMLPNLPTQPRPPKRSANELAPDILAHPDPIVAALINPPLDLSDESGSIGEPFITSNITEGTGGTRQNVPPTPPSPSAIHNARAGGAPKRQKTAGTSLSSNAGDSQTPLSAQSGINPAEKRPEGLEGLDALSQSGEDQPSRTQNEGGNPVVQH